MIFTDGIHLVSDNSLDELHEFAQKIGLKRKWFQDKRLPHYDITSKRIFKISLDNGAKITTSRDIVKIIKKVMSNGMDS